LKADFIVKILINFHENILDLLLRLIETQWNQQILDLSGLYLSTFIFVCLIEQLFKLLFQLLWQIVFLHFDVFIVIEDYFERYDRNFILCWGFQKIKYFVIHWLGNWVVYISALFNKLLSMYRITIIKKVSLNFLHRESFRKTSDNYFNVLFYKRSIKPLFSRINHSFLGLLRLFWLNYFLRSIFLGGLARKFNFTLLFGGLLFIFRQNLFYSLHFYFTKIAKKICQFFSLSFFELVVVYKAIDYLIFLNCRGIGEELV